MAGWFASVTISNVNVFFRNVRHQKYFEDDEDII